MEKAGKEMAGLLKAKKEILKKKRPKKKVNTTSFPVRTTKAEA